MRTITAARPQAVDMAEDFQRRGGVVEADHHPAHRFPGRRQQDPRLPASPTLPVAPAVGFSFDPSRVEIEGQPNELPLRQQSAEARPRCGRSHRRMTWLSAIIDCTAISMDAGCRHQPFVAAGSADQPVAVLDQERCRYASITGWRRAVAVRLPAETAAFAATPTSNKAEFASLRQRQRGYAS